MATRKYPGLLEGWASAAEGTSSVMRLGKFRVKRTLLGLASTVLILSVVKYYTADNDHLGLSDNFRFDRRLVGDLAGNVLAGDAMMKNLNERTNDTQLKEHFNVTNFRKERDEEAASEMSEHEDDMEDEEDTHARKPEVEPSERLFLTDIRERSNLLRQQCQKLKNQIERVNVIRSPPEGLIINEKHKLLYCVVPKAACSSWKEFFFQIGGFAGDQSLRQKKRKLVLEYLDHLSYQDRAKVYPKLYKFIFVRHPFIRLLSAYRDKIAPNGSYERLHAKYDTRSHYFWRNRIGLDIVSAYHGRSVANRMKTNHDEYSITFLEFVRYLVEHSEHPATEDRHWNPMYKLCRPCDIKYQFIANFETIETDSVFIRRLVRTDLPEKNKHATNSSNLDFALSYYRDIPKDLMSKLYERYRYDFELFGYNPKPFL